MSTTKAIKIVRSHGYSVGNCANGTKRVTKWENNKIVYGKFFSLDEFKAFALELGELNE